MPATLAFTPAKPNQGQEVIIQGRDFVPSVAGLLTVVSPKGEVTTYDITTDVSGDFATTDEANPASTTITSSGVEVTANDTVTIDGVVYTFKASVTTTANEVKMGGTAALTLANLKKAINLSGVGGTDYGSLTVIHPTVEAQALTATVLTVVAKTPGTGGNSLVIAKSAVTLTVVSPFAGGTALIAGQEVVRIYPQNEGIYTVTFADGTNSVVMPVQVWKSA